MTRPAQHYIILSILAAVATIALKLAAWRLSGSVGLLSDALESFVNLAGALFALAMIRWAEAPPDREHPFGHTKAEYFSSGFEGTLIFIAALLILFSAVPRLLAPRPLQALDLGLLCSGLSTLLNFLVSRTLSKAAQRLESVALDADARHLMTDVWTSIGVIGGLIAVMLTGWLWLDGFIAICVAGNILREGWRLMHRAVDGLMDMALPPAEIRQIEDILQSYAARDVAWSGLQTRRAGSQRFVVVKILVPGHWRVDQSHDVLDEIEARIAAVLPNTRTTTHLEPMAGGAIR